MSISFNTPVKALASFGLSVGDIAALAGAGRAVGTWLRARSTDQALLEIVDVENIIPRTGLVDAATLDNRWAKRMVVFADGRLLPIQEREASEILKKVKLDRFTWIMTLITTALMVSTSQSCLENVILEVLTERCQESEGYEYLVRDLKRNIECWMSTARTRTIANSAEQRWHDLEVRKFHLPGLIPDTDYKELCRFLLWLIGAGDGGRFSSIYRTASSDTASLAVILQHIGIDGIRVLKPDDVIEEGVLSVIFDTTRLASEPVSAPPKRRGMRINLDQMEEIMSLWPGSAALNNHRRDLFLSAANSTNGISITVGQWLIADLRDVSKTNLQPLFVFAYGQNGRLQSQVYQFASVFFLAADQRTLDAFQSMISIWNQAEPETAQELLAVMNERYSEISPSHFSDVQTFMLGYYYGLLRSIIDVSQMNIPEAFGSWTWNDWELFNILKSGTKADLGVLRLINDQQSSDVGHGASSTEGLRTSVNRLRYWERHSVLKLVAYLFAGAEIKQIRSVERGCCGIKGKLTVVDAALLGDADHWARIRDFVLLDVDDTVFPSNSLGVIRGGGQKLNMRSMQRLQAPSTMFPLEDIVLAQGTKDFTSLVEPKWGEDMDACMLTYRRAGRLVHTIDPEVIFHAILGASQLSPEIECHGQLLRFVTERLAIDGLTLLDNKDQEQCRFMHKPAAGPREVSPWNTSAQLNIEYFDGGRIPMMESAQSNRIHRFCVATNDLPKIRSCLVGVCNVPFSFNTLDFPYKRERDLPSGMVSGLVVDLDCGQILIK